MKTQSKAHNAGLVLLTIQGGVIIFHLLVLLQIIPYNAVWAGRIHSLQEMYTYESLSILLNLLLVLVICQRIGITRQLLPKKLVTGVLWFFTVLFALNTVGNLFAKSKYEMIIGGVLTLVSSILCFMLARRTA